MRSAQLRKSTHLLAVPVAIFVSHWICAIGFVSTAILISPNVPTAAAANEPIGMPTTAESSEQEGELDLGDEEEDIGGDDESDSTPPDDDAEEDAGNDYGQNLSASFKPHILFVVMDDLGE